ncbi:hypothetical protein ACLESD_08665 [Pyxidicoccus sp. 3LFB2]
MRKRAYLAVSGVVLPPGVVSIELAPGIFAAADWPDGKPPLMRGVREIWGSDRLTPFDSPNLVVWTERNVEDTVTGRVDLELDSILESCDHALMLSTGFGQAHRFTAKELWNGDERSPGGTAVPETSWAARGFRRMPVVDAKRWAAVTTRLMEVVAPGWQRHEFIVRGLVAFFRACREDWVEVRHELFCRSVETVLQTEPGQGATQFVEGILSEQRRFDRTKRQLVIETWRQLYERRNDVVHGHRFFEEKQDGRAAMLMEEGARRFFCRLLTDASFFEHTVALASERSRGKRDEHAARTERAAARRRQRWAARRRQ